MTDDPKLPRDPVWWFGFPVGNNPLSITQKAKKERERRPAAEWLRRRGIAARLQDHEHPDFIVEHGSETLGIEVVQFHAGGPSRRGGSSARQVEAAWEALCDYSCDYRKLHSDIDPFVVVLHFSRHRMPSAGSFEEFCDAVARLIRQHGAGIPEDAKLDLAITADIDKLLASYLRGMQIIKCRTHWEEWQWPALLSGHVGASEDELAAVVAGKLQRYRAPPHLTSSHLVVVGAGPTLSRVAAPLSAAHLATYSRLNRVLSNGSFDTVALLGYRDFIWSKAEGWTDFPAYE